MKTMKTSTLWLVPTLLALLIVATGASENGANVQTPSASGAAVQASREKVTLCHRKPNGDLRTIRVPASRVDAHLAHGDSLGECGTPPTGCCDPALEPGTNGVPPCFEGHSCCSDGAWRCNGFGGEPSCSLGEVCPD